MRKLHRSALLVTLLVALSAMLSSCFKEEPLNAECDIEQVSLTVDNPDEFFFNITDASQEVLSDQINIVFNVRSKADLSALAPTFKITEGATIVPASGSTHDFSNGNVVKYTVTSQDGNWHRDYSVSFRKVVITKQDTIKYDLDNYELEPQKQLYYIWHNIHEDGTLGNDWASGNDGYKFTGAKDPMTYPTTPDVNGYDGACVKLSTKDTGPLGKTLNKPIAAGNLYLGVFDGAVSLGKPLKATRFGLPFSQKPSKFIGYYKYKPGATYKNKAGKVIEKTDSCAIYSVLYKNHDENGNAVVLYGDDVLTSPQIVAIAIAKNVYPVNEWTAFEAIYDYYQEIDEELLPNRGYSLTIVFSSSYEGADFAGAIGSELWVDKVRLISIKEE